MSIQLKKELSPVFGYMSVQIDENMRDGFVQRFGKGASSVVTFQNLK